MKWLAQKKQERRWWTASASIAVLGVVLGIVGVVPAFANLDRTSCAAVEHDGSVTVQWSAVPDGLALVVLAQDSSGNLTEVPNDGGAFVGYGPEGSWTGPAYPGAVAYHISGDAASGGGTVRCGGESSSAGPVTVTAPNAVGATNPGFEAGVCPISSTGEPYGYRFLAPGEGRVVESVRVVFADAGEVTYFARGAHRGDVIVYTAEPDTIETAEATISGPEPDGATFALVHVCAPDTPPAGDDGGDDTSADDTGTGADGDDPPVDTPGDDGGLGGDDGGAGDDDGTSGAVARISATLYVVCGPQGVVVTVTNDGDASGIAEVLIDGSVVETVTVEPLGQRSVEIESPIAGTVVSVRTADTTVAQMVLDDPCGVRSPQLDARTAVDCDADEIVVTVTNTGDAAGTAEVTIGDTVDTVEVAPGAEIDVTAPRPGDGTAVTITMSDGDRVVVDTTVDPSCREAGPDLSATITIVCDDSPAAVVTVTNAGSSAGAATIDADGAVSIVEVAPEETRTSTVPVTVGADVTIEVRAGEQVLAARTQTDVCRDPAPSLNARTTLDCDTGSIRVILSNTGDAAGIAFVEVDGVSSTVIVPAGTESVFTADVEPGEDLTVHVHDGVRSLASETFSGVCGRPAPALSATHATDCGRAVVTVTVHNGGDAAAGATIAYAGTSVVRQVAPGASVSESFPAPTTRTTLVVAGPGVGDTAVLEADVAPCGTPEPRVGATTHVDCQLGEIVLSMRNTGDAASTVTWRVNGRSATATIEPGADLVVSAPVLIGAQNVIGVVADGVTVLDDTLDRACVAEGPAIRATMDIDCGNERIVVAVTNTGGTDGTAKVVINGEATDVAVPAGTSVDVRGVLPDGLAYLVAVSSGDEVLLTRQGTATQCREYDAGGGGIVARVSASCRFDDAIAEIVNDDEVDRTVTITFNGTSEDAVVPAGSRIERTFPLVEDEAYTIAVVDDSGQSLAYVSGIHDCVQVEGETIDNPDHVDESTPISLPHTGANSGPLVGAAITLIAAGLLALKASKLRRIRLTAP